MRLTKQRLLRDLHAAYGRASERKRRSPDMAAFAMNAERELIRLRDEIYSHAYRPSPCIAFIVTDPTRREVFAARFRDRVVHHLYYAYTRELYERTFIRDAYSCIEGRGTSDGVARLRGHIKAESRGWTETAYALKLDIKGYFMHIDRGVLLRQCMAALDKMAARPCGRSRRPWEETHDRRLVEYLTRVFVTHDPLEGCAMKGARAEWRDLPPSKSLFHSPPGRGLPIGNLTSQLFSNVYLNSFDHYCKRALGCRRYGRYVDDAYVVSRDREWLLSLVPKIRAYLKEELKLDLHPDKLRVDECRLGVEFLGAYIKPGRTYVSGKTVRRVRRNLAAMRPERLSPRYVMALMNSLAGLFARYAGRWTRLATLCGAGRRALAMGRLLDGGRRFELYRSVIEAERKNAD